MVYFPSGLADPKTIAIDILLVLVILLYGVLLARLVPRKAHITTNLLAGAVTVGLGLLLGLTLPQMGLTLHGVKSIILISVAVSAAIFIGTFLVSFIPSLKQFFLGESFANARARSVFFEAGFRIPLGTALVEEVLFRGVLLGLLLQAYSPLVASVIAAIAFGFWHIAPSINSFESNNEAQKQLREKSLRKFGSVVSIVIVTTIAGLFFNWLRIISGTILTPWLVHWAINSSGALASAAQGKIRRIKS